MAIQHRRGVYGRFDPYRMSPGEYAVVLDGDPAASDGKAVYMCFTAGDVKRLATFEDLQDFFLSLRDEAVVYVQETAYENLASDLDAAIDAAHRAEETSAENEADRVASEAVRKASEKLRAAAESERIAAEDARLSAEAERAAAEGARIVSEALRDEAEDDRLASESERKEAEEARLAAEAELREREAVRIDNEQGRIEAERIRRQAHADRTSDKNIHYGSEPPLEPSEGTTWFVTDLQTITAVRRWDGQDNEGALYPSEGLFPAPDLYPAGTGGWEEYRFAESALALGQ